MIIGVELEQVDLVLTRNRDFKWAFENLDANGIKTAFPAGTLYFELYHTSTPTVWPFTIVGSAATIKVESQVVDTIPARTKWQLVFRASNESAGGDPLAYGTVRFQG